MNAFFLKDLAKKTHRGLEGRNRQGHSAGGLTYGYDVTSSNSTERGGRTINDGQAAVVEQIFSDFAKGKSPLAIAKHLNLTGIAGPGGRS